MTFNLILNLVVTFLLSFVLMWLFVKNYNQYKNYIAFPYSQKEKNTYYKYRTLYGIVLFITYIKFIELGYILAVKYLWQI